MDIQCVAQIGALPDRLGDRHTNLCERRERGMPPVDRAQPLDHEC
jgi:hypothetical protein